MKNKLKNFGELKEYLLELLRDDFYAEVTSSGNALILNFDDGRIILNIDEKKRYN